MDPRMKKEKLLDLRTGKVWPARCNDNWSEIDDKLLLMMFNDELADISDMALAFDRSEVAVYARLMQLKQFIPQCRYRSKSDGGYNKTCRCSKCKVLSCLYCGTDGPCANESNELEQCTQGDEARM